jgi:hypothetical protein
VSGIVRDASLFADGRAPDTIVLIHGFWVTPRSWEHWIARVDLRPAPIEAATVAPSPEPVATS